MDKNLRTILAIVALFMSATVWADDYNVSVATVQHGSVDVSLAKAPAGTEITLTPHPDSGYYMESVTIEKGTGPGAALAPRRTPAVDTSVATLPYNPEGKYTFTMPAYDVIVTATFSPRVDISSAVVTLDQDKAVYDGTAQTFTVKSVMMGDTELLADKEYTASPQSKIGVSSYTFTVNGAGKYKGEVTTTYQITKCPVTVSGIKCKTKVYNRKTGVTLDYTDVVFANLVEGEQLTVTAMGVMEDANAGENKPVTLSNMTLGGTNIGNYVLAEEGQQTTATVTVVPLKVTVPSGIVANNKQYDGTTTATFDGSGATITGKIAGDELTVEAKGDFADKNIEDNKTVTITEITFAGAAKDNYQLAATGNQTSATANIVKCEVSVSGIVAEDKYFDGTTDAKLSYANVVINGKVEGENLYVKATGNFENANVGTDKSVVISNLELQGSDKDHYQLSAEEQQTTATASILPAHINCEPIVITDIDAPVKDQAFDNGYIHNDIDGLSFGTLTWYLGDEEVTGQAAPNRAYTVKVTVNADDPNYVPTITSATINGETATVSENTISYTFPKTAKKSFSDATITFVKPVADYPDDYDYTGAAVEPAIIVKMGEEVIDANSYTVSYSNNEAVGNHAVVTATAKADETVDFEGAVEETFYITRKVTAGDNEWMTFINESNLDATGCFNVRLITAVNAPVVTLSADLSFIPANTPVLLQQTGTSKTYHLKATDAGEYPASAPEFKGVLVDTDFDNVAPHNENIYILKGEDFVLANRGTLAANHCYIALGGAASARLFFEGEVTGVGDSDTFKVYDKTTDENISLTFSATEVQAGTEVTIHPVISGGNSYVKKIIVEQVEDLSVAQARSAAAIRPQVVATLEYNAAGNYSFTMPANDVYVTVETADRIDISLNPSDVSFTMDRTSAAYNGLDQDFNVTQVTYAGEVLNATTEYSADTQTQKNAGDYNFYITGAGKYMGQIQASFAITKVVLTVTADDQTMGYGESLPELTVSYDGFVNDETAAVLTKAATATTEATATSAIGEYPIVPAGAESDNYTFTYVNGKLVISKGDATVTTLPAANELTYKGVAQQLVTAGVAQGGQLQYSLNGTEYSTTIPTGTQADNYQVYYKVVADENHNDFIATEPVAVEIGKAPLTITADNQAIAYGDAIPELTISYAGFVNDEDHTVLTKQPVAQTTATAESVANAYPITVSGAEADNYAISYVDGTLVIGKAMLTVTADNQQMTFRGSVPELTYQISGFVNGDDIYDLTTRPSVALSETITADSPAGSYTGIIVASNGAAANYMFEYVNGTLTILPKDLSNGATILLSPESVEYDGNIQKPELTVLETSPATLLSEGIDYTINWGDGDYTAPGFYTVGVEFIGNYTGTMTADKQFEIQYVIPTDDFFTVGCDWNPSCMDKDLSLEGVTGLEVYTVSSIDAEHGVIMLTRQNAIKAGVPMLFHRTGAESSFVMKILSESPTLSGELSPAFKVADTDLDMSVVGANGDKWIFVNDMFVRSKKGILAAGKCYIDMASAAARLILQYEGVGTGIETMSDGRGQMSDVWYDLSGRKLSDKPTKAGIYVNNGIKVVIK